MATRQTAKAKAAPKAATRKTREATALAAAIPNITGKWDITITPHGMVGVVTSFIIRIDAMPTADGVIEGSLINASGDPIPGGELVGVVFTSATSSDTIMSFKISVSGLKHCLIGVVIGSSFPLRFQGKYVRITKVIGFEPNGAEAARLAPDPGETGSGTGNQTT